MSNNLHIDYEERKALGEKLGKAAAEAYLCRGELVPKPRWLLIENGEFFRLHRIKSAKAVLTVRGGSYTSESFAEAVSYACLFCFRAGETPAAHNVHLYPTIEAIPEYYRSGVEPTTVSVSKVFTTFSRGQK